MLFQILCLLVLNFIDGKIVTIGDSFAAGTGIHSSQDDYHDAACWREVDLIPGSKYASEVGEESVVLACFGEYITGAKRQVDLMGIAFPNDASENWNGSTILLSVGGMNVRSWRGDDWIRILVRCIFESKCHENNQNDVSNLEEVKSDLISLYEKIRNEASMARLRIVGYPFLMNSRSPCFVWGVTSAEATYMDMETSKVNKMISDAVDEIKSSSPNFDIEFVDVAQYFKTGACSFFFFREINGLAINDRDFLASFHPNQRGYDRYYEAIVDSL